MSLRNCSSCGGIFIYSGVPICSSCVKRQQDDFECIRAYLKGHPNSNLWDIEKGTGIDGQVILSYLREGRLRVSDICSLSYPCERCEQPTQQGRYCSACKEELTASMTDSVSSLKARPKPFAGYYSRSQH